MTKENLKKVKERIAADCPGSIGSPVVMCWQEYERADSDDDEE